MGLLQNSILPKKHTKIGLQRKQSSFFWGPIALIASAKSVSAQRNHVLAERKSTWENRSIENEGIFFK
jgi:hypothetical protein